MELVFLPQQSAGLCNSTCYVGKVELLSPSNYHSVANYHEVVIVCLDQMITYWFDFRHRDFELLIDRLSALASVCSQIQLSLVNIKNIRIIPSDKKDITIDLYLLKNCYKRRKVAHIFCNQLSSKNRWQQMVMTLLLTGSRTCSWLILK